MISLPEVTEYQPYYARYVSLVRGPDLNQTLEPNWPNRCCF